MDMKLKEYLIRNNIKQVNITKQTGISASVLSDHVNEIRPMAEKYLLKLCEFLNLPVKEINSMTKFNLLTKERSPNPQGRNK